MSSMIFLGRLGEAELLSDGPRVSAAAAQWIENAQAMIEAVRVEAESIREQARREGEAEGLARGQLEIAVQLNDALAKAGRHLKDLEPVLVDAVVVAVGKLVGEAGRAPLIERAVLHVRERLAEAEGLTLRVPAALLAQAQAAARALAEHHGLLLPLRVEADAGLTGDQCIVESSLGRAQLRFDEQLDRLRRALSDAFGSVEQPS